MQNARVYDIFAVCLLTAGATLLASGLVRRNSRRGEPAPGQPVRFTDLGIMVPGEPEGLNGRVGAVAPGADAAGVVTRHASGKG